MACYTGSHRCGQGDCVCHCAICYAGNGSGSDDDEHENEGPDKESLSPCIDDNEQSRLSSKPKENGPVVANLAVNDEEQTGIFSVDLLRFHVIYLLIYQ